MRAPEITFPALLQDFFLRRLIEQRGVSARTVESYRDAFELLLTFAGRRAGKLPSALSLADLDAPLVLDFLDHLESERGNSARTRNARRLLYPDWPIRRGNISARCLLTYRSHRCSEVNPSSADITAKVSSSASLRVGGMPPSGRAGARSGHSLQHVVERVRKALFRFIRVIRMLAAELLRPPLRARAHRT